MTANDIPGLITNIVLLWVLAIGLFLLVWVRFAQRRKRLENGIEADRQRRLDNELTDLTSTISDQDRLAVADVQRHWAKHDRAQR